MFDGTLDNDRELRAQMLSQVHIFNTYCTPRPGTCRFFFPFPIRERGGLAARSSDPEDTRRIALAPRCTPYVNSTHPMLTSMHSNTDVTIVTGNSIAESMYVCSYAVKAGKHPFLMKRHFADYTICVMVEWMTGNS